MSIDRNAIGSHGEAIVMTVLTRMHGLNMPLFRPQFLGAKYPAIDLFVELVGVAGEQTPFFLAQIKTTTTGYTPTGRLQVRLDRDALDGLRRFPAPVYMICVDDVSETAYIAAAVANGQRQFRSFPTTHSLNKLDTLQTLHHEVAKFWRDRDIRFTHSTFVEQPEHRRATDVG